MSTNCDAIKDQVYTLSNKLQEVIGYLELGRHHAAYRSCRQAVAILREISKQCAVNVPLLQRFNLRGQ